MYVHIDIDEVLCDISDEELIKELERRQKSCVEYEIDKEGLYRFFSAYKGNIPDSIRQSVMNITQRII